MRWNHPTAAAIAAAILLAGCGDEDKPRPSSAACEPCVMSSIVGRVVGTPLPVRASVTATRVLSLERAVVSVDCDSTGRFLLPVVEGDYTLLATVREPERHAWVRWTAAGGTMSSGEEDTLHVTPLGPAVAEFRLGAIEIELHSPLDETGQEAEIFFLAENQSWPSSALWQRFTPGSLNRLRFSVVPNGQYRAKLRWEDDGEEIWLPGTYDPEEADVIESVVGKTTVYGVRLLARGRITGRVTGEWRVPGSPAPRFEAVNRRWSNYSFRRVDVGEDGSFEMDFHAPAYFRGRITIGSVSRWIGGWTEEEATAFDLYPGQSVDLGDLPTHTLRVNVESEIPFDAGPRIGLRLVPAHPGAEEIVGGGFLAPELFLRNLMPGQYTLKADHPRLAKEDWAWQWYDGATFPEDALDFEVLSDRDVTDLTLHLREGARLPCRVRAANGDSLDRIVLRLSPARDRWDWRGGEFYPDSLGDFWMRGLPPGAWRVGATRGSRISWYPGGLWEDADTIQVEGPGILDRIEWQLLEE